MGGLHIIREKNLNISFLLDFYGAALTDKQRDAIDLYYNQDLSLAEIAEHTGITRQGVRDCIKHGEAAMLQLEEKLGIAQRLSGYTQNFEQILDRANKIKYSKSNINYYKILDDNVDGIIELCRGQLE